MKLRNVFLAASFAASLTVFAGNPKYVFYMIGDGMGMGAVSAAQGFLNAVDGDGAMLQMLQMPVASMSQTYSASSPVTDSAAAGTALACGHKTRNGMLGMDADTVAVQSIAARFHDNGFGVGLVTTVAPDDATPGAFYAHVPRRSMYYEIGCDAARSGYEFIGGANLRGAKNTDLMARLADAGVDVVRGREAAAKSTSRRVMMLNTDSVKKNNVGYTIDSIAGVLTLADLTESCLKHLMRVSPDGFFMMVEGGTIDHAAHSNDAATVVMQTLDFDRSIGLVRQFAASHPGEALIVVTADHETGGMGMASLRHHYNQRLDLLAHQRMSKDAFAEWTSSVIKSGNAPAWEDMKGELARRVGLFGAVAVDEADEEALKALYETTLSHMGGDKKSTFYSSFDRFTDKVYDLMSALTGVGWTTGDHSGAVVPVFAEGEGLQLFAPAQDNVDIPVKIMKAVGL